jgi:3',5'-cyclic AMP phosphodiesterase CpdA
MTTSVPKGKRASSLAIVLVSISLVLPIAFLGSACSPPATAELPSNAIIVYGDSRSGHSIHKAIVRTIIKTEPSAVFHTGDLVYDGSSSAEWATFNSITSELVESTPFYPALGNHDLPQNHDLPPQLFLDNFDLPNNERWYTVEVDGLHFIILDSNTDLVEGSEQYEWLENELLQVADEFAAVVFHHPLLSTGPHGDELDLGPILVPLFEEYDVELVLNGHDHDYERSFKDGVYYLVVGGGGAPLYQQEGSSDYSQVFKSAYHFCALTVSDGGVTIQAFDLDLRIIDQFSIEYTFEEA